MQPRVAYVSPIAPDSESQVRRAHEQFPEHVLDEVGIRSITAFIGSDYYVMLFDFADGDFQEQFARFTGHPAVRSFFDTVGAYLMEPLPQSVQPGDAFHASGTAHGVQGTTTARLPLVGEVFNWGTSR